MKRKLAFLLALCILTTLLMPMTAFAADEVTNPVWEVINEGEDAIKCANLAAAKKALKAGGTLKLLKDFTYTNAAIASIDNSNFTLDGNGNTLTYVCTDTSITQKTVVSLSGTGEITVKNLTIALGSANDANLKVSGLSISGAGADVTLENCHFKVNRIAVWVTGENAKLTINSGSYESITNGAVVQLAKAGVECTVNGGTFTQNAVQYIFRPETFKTLTINGGTFNQNSNMSILYACGTAGGEINISGGNFRYLAAGNSGRFSILTTTHHKVTVSGGLFELHDTKNTAAFGPSDSISSDATEKGTLSITRAVFVSNNNITLYGEKLDSSFASVTVAENAVSYYGLAVDSESYYTEHEGIAMADGAAVRLVSAKPEDSGIRFTSTISAEMVAAAKAAAKEGTTVTYGTVLVPTEKLGTTDFSIPALEANGIQYQNIVAEVGLEGSDEDGYTLRCALIQIKTSHYDMALSARAYVSWVDANGRTVYVYSSYSEALNSRSISQVAKAALEDITIAYTEAQKAILNGYLGKSSAESSADSNS